MADLKDLKGALVFAMKFEAAQQATRKDRHPIRAVNESDTSNSDRDGEKIDIHGKLKVKIKFGDATYQHAVYVADIADPFILGLDFLKEHGFTLDFNKNELRSIHEEVTIFKIEHRTESIRRVFQKGEVLATCSPVTCVCKVRGLLLSNSPQQLTPDLLENAELSPEQKSSAERLFKNLKTCFLKTVAILAILQ
ncbi:retrovirus-related Pol polyprotein from transposon 412 [Trichonephila clavipes]|nr:retrovirus-related Pol polyprotein from transposon 412 [Trichonephila clavipes]